MLKFSGWPRLTWGRIVMNLGSLSSVWETLRGNITR